MNIVIILPTQLFDIKENDLINRYSNKVIILYEHPLYFTKFKYHKMKLVMHRSSMKRYYDILKENIKCKIVYIDFNNKCDINQFLLKIVSLFISNIHFSLLNLSTYLDSSIQAGNKTVGT